MSMPEAEHFVNYLFARVRPTFVGMREPALWSLLLCYAVASFAYSALCGGSKYPPLAAYQVYALAMPVWFALGLALYRLRSPLPRLWPPTKREALQAFAAVLVLTAETLALLMPASVVAIVAGKGGCLVFPDPTDPRPWHKKLRLAGLAFLAVVLASLHKPLRLLWLPLLLAILYIIGHRLALRAVRMAKVDRDISGFFGAAQVLVIGGALALAAVFHGVAPSAPVGDVRLWVVAAASMACGLLGLRIKLHRTPEGVVFPAYRAASLCCALGASAARGEALHWSGWAAVALALGIVLWASAEGFLRRCARWLRVTWAVAVSLAPSPAFR